MRGGFFCLSWPEITPLIVSSAHIWAFSLNEMVFSTQYEFYLIFLYFLKFFSLTYCGMCLFVVFCVGVSDGSAALIRQRSHIKSLFISMLH